MEKYYYHKRGFTLQEARTAMSRRTLHKAGGKENKPVHKVRAGFRAYDCDGMKYSHRFSGVHAESRYNSQMPAYRDMGVVPDRSEYETHPAS
jgi:hypothetical protein